MIRGLGLDRHPELHPVYFGNYRKLTYLAQAPKAGAEDKARAVAERMGLQFEYRQTGYGALQTTLVAAVKRARPHTEEIVPWVR